MSNNQLINEIKAKLTGNREEDYHYLETELVIYQTLGNEEVVMAISMMLFDYLDSQTKAAYDLKAHQILNQRQGDYQEVMRMLNDNKLLEAEEILLKLTKNYELTVDNFGQNYYDFDQLIEYVIFCETVKQADQLKIKRCPEPITYFYYQLAIIQEKKGDESSAFYYLEKALKFNPVCQYVLHEALDIYFKQNDNQKFIETARVILENAYTKEQFFNCYEKLGYYFETKQIMDMAIACFVLGGHFKESANTRSNVERITQKAGYINFSTMQDLLNIFEREKISYGPTPKVITAINDFSVYLTKINQYDEAVGLLMTAYQLTDLEYFEEQIKIIKQQKKIKK